MHRLAPTKSHISSVLLLHGYAARPALNLVDAHAFSGPTTEVLLPAAPGHGEREDGTLERIAALPDHARKTAIFDLAATWTSELPAIVEDCRARGAQRVAVVGISMGGLSALASLAAPCPFDAVAAVLASPALVDRATITPGEPPALVGIAGLDSAAPPAAARQFAQAYGAELHEYPHSPHHMRGEDWHNLWGHTAAFLRRHLDTSSHR